uniref:ShKT domain-containing protein n=1 Tax=Parastrongyloides trichosuri TaxID=131310 RepID=A0A0N4Z8M9_PARTI
MNCAKVFTLLLFITLSFTIEGRGRNTYIPRNKLEYQSPRALQPSVHVAGNCQADGQCQVGYTCTNQMCVKPITTTSYRNWKSLQCNDVGKDCMKYQNYCQNSIYTDVLRERCKRTCGYCSKVDQ